MIIYILYVLMNIITGIIIGYLLGRLIFNSVTYVGPNSKDIIKNIYKDNNGICYKLVPKVYVCPLS